MAITNIISAIGNNSSVYPLLVRDCGIENPIKVYLTNRENRNDKDVQKLATRERFIDEYTVSSIWLGGVPFVEWVSNKFIKGRGFNPDLNLKLLNEDEAVILGKIKKSEQVQGLEYNIKKFQGKVSDEVMNDLKKMRSTSAKNTYKNLLAGKFVAATAIPIALIGFIVPKLIFASSSKRIEALKAEKAQKAQNSNQKAMPMPALTSDVFQGFSLKNENPTFTGNWASTLANMSTVQKMAVIDGGYAAGRIATARKSPDGKRNEAKDVAFKMAGMMYLNYVAPKQLEKLLNFGTKKIFNLDVNLDPLMLEDKEFIKKITDGTLELPKSNSAKDLLDFIDNNPKSIFTKYANKFEKVKLLENGVRDPRAYVDIENLANFRKDVESFAKAAKESSKNGSQVAEAVAKFAKRAKGVKTVNILANVGISSFLLAYCLPKAQFAFRRLVTGSELEPGLANRA